MTPEYSKMVLVQINLASELVRAIQTHQARILNQLIEQLKPRLGDLEPEVFAYFMAKTVDILIEHLEDATQTMGEADLAHTYNLMGTQQARNHREEALEDTFRKIFAVKMSLLGTHGETALAMLGMVGETPRVPAELERWLEKILNVVRGGVVLPPVIVPGMHPWSTKQLESALAPLMSELRTALDKVSQKQHDEKDTMTTKWQQMERHNYIYTAMASICESGARLAGEHDLGDRLRPRTLNRPGKKKDKKNAENGTANPPETPGPDSLSMPSSAGALHAPSLGPNAATEWKA